MGEQQKVNQADTDLNHVLKARRDKLAELQTAGKDPFQITKYDVTAHSMDIKDNYEQWEGKEAAIAGRMMFKRVMGKASFCNVQDLKGSIQVYVARDSVGEESYKDFKKMDIGDIVGVKGTAFTTKTGEISIHATEVTLLSKSLQVLPEKFHALPPALRGPDHERRGEGYIHQAFQDTGCHPQISGRRGLYGSGDPYAGFQCWRRCRKAF